MFETRVPLRKKHKKLTEKHKHYGKSNGPNEFPLKGNLMMMDVSTPWVNICVPPDSYIFSGRKGGFLPQAGARKHLKLRLPHVPSPRKELPSYALNASNHSTLKHQPKRTAWGLLANKRPAGTLSSCEVSDWWSRFYSSHSQGEKPNLPDLSPSKGSGGTSPWSMLQ